MGAVLPGLLAVLGPHIPGWIRAIEDAFKGKPKSGEIKMDTLLQIFLVLAQNFIKSGAPLPDGTKLPDKPVINDAEVRGALEALFQQWKNSGASAVPVSNSLSLIQGQFTITPLGVKL